MPVLLGALVTAAALAGCGDAGEPSPGPHARTGRARDGRTAEACGWIPAEAQEVTPVASLQGGSAGDPLCANIGSPLDAPKAVAASIDKELREATRMSDEEEDRIGRRLEAALPRERELAGKLDRPEDVQRYGGYLRDIVQHLAEHTTRPGVRWRIHLVRLPVFNAAALPGGVMLVFTGTLEGPEAAHTEAELAAVLGHEMAHVERRHVVATYQFARAALGDDSDEAVLVMRMLTQPLSTERELEADDRGTELAVLGQYDPRAVVDLWRRHAQEEQQSRRGRRGGRSRSPERGPGGSGGAPEMDWGPRRGSRRPGRAPDVDRSPDGVFGEVLEGVQALLDSHPPAAVRACHAMDKLAWAREHATCDRLYDGQTNVRTHVAGPRRAY